MTDDGQQTRAPGRSDARPDDTSGGSPDQSGSGSSAATDETEGSGSESRGTVLLALSANAAIAVAKLVGGVLSGSAAMLAESAHSVADTMNQGFLLTALHRSNRRPTDRHPFGYGKERYFWTLLAAVGIFVAGGLFSILEGVEAILNPTSSGDPVINLVVLGVAFVFEGSSWLKAVLQVRREAGEQHRSIIEHLRLSPDPTVKTVAFEDSAALVGVTFAATGIILHDVTGAALWDGLASIAIGLLLVGVAIGLGSDTKAMLIGEAAPAEVRDRIETEIERAPGIKDVMELRTMQLGPDEMLVAARVDLADGSCGDEVERLMESVDAQLNQRFDGKLHVFLDPTRPGPPGDPELLPPTTS